MIVALNKKGGANKTTLVLRLARKWAGAGRRRVTGKDAGRQGSALDWSQRRAREGLPRLFGGVKLAPDRFHQKASELARAYDHVVIDRPADVEAATRSALLACNLALISAPPSLLDGCASDEMLTLRHEMRIDRPQLTARFAYNGCDAGAVSAHDMGAMLSGRDPLLRACVGQRVAFANAAQR